MGEIFRSERASDPLAFTGERYTPLVSGEIELEHLHRYLQARDLCRGKDVLDVASGEGYGAALLAQVAHSVVGVEVDAGVVAHALRAYSRMNLAFTVGDARCLPLDDASVDVVTSFETIEHFFEHDQFLSEIRRVLRPGGMVVISTPDRDVYSPAGSPANDYHVHELSEQEFFHALRKQFSHIIMYRQRSLSGSVLTRDNGEMAPVDTAIVTYEKRDEGHLERCQGMPRAKYILAIASDGALSDPLNAVSLYIETSQLDRRSAELTTARAELGVAQAALRGLEARERQLQQEAGAQLEELAALRGLEAREQQLQQEARAQAEELAAAQAALRGLEAREQQLQQDTGARSEELAAAQAALQEREARELQLQQEAGARSEELAAARAALREREARELQLQQDNGARSEELAAAQAALRQREARERQLQQEAGARSEELAIVQAALHELEAQRHQWRLWAGAQSAELATARMDLAAARTQLWGCQSKVRELEKIAADAQEASRVVVDSQRRRSLFVDRFLGWSSSYSQIWSNQTKRSVRKARHFAKRRNWLAAEKHYRAVLVEAPRLTPIWIQYAHAVKEQGDLWAACGAYSRAVALDPANSEAHVHLGHVQKQLGMTDDALSSLRSALQLRPSRLDLWRDLTELGQESEQLVTQVLGAQSRPGPLRSGSGLRFTLIRYRARVAGRRRDWKLAARYYRRLVKLAPDDPAIWLLYGHAEKESGDYAMAAAAYLQALVLDPINEEPRRHFDAVWQISTL